MGWLFAVGARPASAEPGVVLLSLVPILSATRSRSVSCSTPRSRSASSRRDAAGARPPACAHGLGPLALRFTAIAAASAFGMQTGLLGLGFWSLLMATAHGAGLMLLPSRSRSASAPGRAGELTSGGSLAAGLAVVAVHTGAMLVVIAAIAIVVYEWVGLAFLRRGWINLDLVWSARARGKRRLHALCGMTLSATQHLSAAKAEQPLALPRPVTIAPEMQADAANARRPCRRDDRLPRAARLRLIQRRLDGHMRLEAHAVNICRATAPIHRQAPRATTRAAETSKKTATPLSIARTSPGRISIRRCELATWVRSALISRARSPGSL